jgi:hypothetical protein
MRGRILSLLVCGTLLTACGGSGSKPLGWQYVGTTGSELTIQVDHDSDDNGLHSRVKESSSSAQIDVTTTPCKGDCSGTGLSEPLIVDLAKPLGGRTLKGCRHDRATRK